MYRSIEVVTPVFVTNWAYTYSMMNVKIPKGHISCLIYFMGYAFLLVAKMSFTRKFAILHGDITMVALRSQCTAA